MMSAMSASQPVAVIARTIMGMYRLFDRLHDCGQ